MKSNGSGARDKHDAEMKAELGDLANALRKTDDLVLNVLRFHLATEFQIDRFLDAKLPNSKRYLEGASPRFRDKLMLLHAFDVVPGRVVAALKEVNWLRNHCAHEQHYVVGAADIDKIGKHLEPEYQSLRRKAGDDLRALLAYTFATLYGELVGSVLSEIRPELAILAPDSDE
jgi:hypothetical protein